MIKFVAILALVATPATAYPRTMPIPHEPGTSCPSGYTQSGSYCVTIYEGAPRAIPRDRGAVCPNGYTGSGSVCVELKWPD